MLFDTTVYSLVLIIRLLFPATWIHQFMILSCVCLTSLVANKLLFKGEIRETTSLSIWDDS